MEPTQSPDLEVLYKDLHRLFLITISVVIAVVIAIAIKALFFMP